MREKPILLFLHGVGSGDPEDAWQTTLEASLSRLGYPGLEGVHVVAPKYPNGLRGVDDRTPLPKVVVPAPRGSAAKANRRDFERRRTAMEVLLGSDDRGAGIVGVGQLAPVVAEAGPFEQARNYVTKPEIRAFVLQRILDHLPLRGRVVIVGHWSDPGIARSAVLESRALMRRSSCQGDTRSSSVERCSI
jgi:hypothetical protein